MIEFRYSPEQVKQIRDAAPGSVDREMVDAAIIVLQSFCQVFAIRVHSANPGKDKRLKRLKELESVLELFPLDSVAEEKLDALFSSADTSGTVRSKVLAEYLANLAAKDEIDGEYDWQDFEVYVTRRNIRDKIEAYSTPWMTERDAAHKHKAPRDDFFVAVFGVWAALNDKRFVDETIDGVTGPAQLFIQAATEPAFIKAGMRFTKRTNDPNSRAKDRDEETYPDPRTVYRAVKKAQEFENGLDCEAAESLRASLDVIQAIFGIVKSKAH